MAEDEDFWDEAALDALVAQPAGLLVAEAPIAEGQGEQEGLDLGALDILAQGRRHERRSKEHMAEMRRALDKKRRDRAKQEVKQAKAAVEESVQSLAILAPSAMRAAGLLVRKCLRAGKDISDKSAISLVQVAFTGGTRMAAERQHTFAHQVEETMCRLLVDRQSTALHVLCRILDRMKAEGLSVVVGMNFEQGVAKITLKSSGRRLLEEVLAKTRAPDDPQLEGGLREFQGGASTSVLNVSGSVMVAAVRGDTTLDRAFHWVLPPLEVPNTKTSTIAAALQRMPLQLDSQEAWVALASKVDGVVAIGCQDRASSNVAFPAPK